MIIYNIYSIIFQVDAYKATWEKTEAPKDDNNIKIQKAKKKSKTFKVDDLVSDKGNL